MYFFLAGGFLDSATSIQLLLSSKTLHVTVGCVVITSHATYRFLISSINGVTSLMDIDK